MQALTIGFGFDGVLTFTHRAFARHPVGKALHPHLPEEPTTWAYWRELGIPDTAYEAALVDFGDAGGYADLEADREAVLAVHQLFDEGHDPVGACARPATAQVRADTFGLVSNLMLPLRHVALGPLSKLEVECDLFFDDDPLVMEQLAEEGEAVGVLLDRPWNQGAEVPRLKWAEVVPVVNGLAKKVDGLDVVERRWQLADEVEVLVRD